MKIKLIFAIIILSSTQLLSQSGALYFFNFSIDEELTNYVKTENKSSQWFSSWSESEAMPQVLIDSIKVKAENVLSDKLEVPVSLCYRKNKKGEEVGSVGVFGMLEGLPDNTYKTGTSACPGSTHYIYLSVQIYASGGSSITMVDKRTKLKPKVQITLKVKDADNNQILKDQVVLKDFDKLRSITKYYGSIEETRSETLSPFDIYAMYLMGLDELIKE